jgi:YopX protein
MSRIIITVPVQLVKAEDGFWLQVEAQSKRSALIHLDEVGGPLTSSIFVEWAGGLFNEALLKRRRDSGVKDKHGAPILEGDILQGYDGRGVRPVRAAVNYSNSVGAFVLSGTGDSGQVWQTENLREANQWEIVGNVFQNAELLAPPTADSKAA